MCRASASEHWGLDAGGGAAAAASGAPNERTQQWLNLHPRMAQAADSPSDSLQHAPDVPRQEHAPAPLQLPQQSRPACRKDILVAEGIDDVRVV